jgi:hypothetical protein
MIQVTKVMLELLLFFYIENTNENSIDEISNASTHIKCDQSRKICCKRKLNTHKAVQIIITLNNKFLFINRSFF